MVIKLLNPGDKIMILDPGCRVSTCMTQVDTNKVYTVVKTNVNHYDVSAQLDDGDLQIGMDFLAYRKFIKIMDKKINILQII